MPELSHEPICGDGRIRRFRSTDSYAELTALLHRAYAPLAEAGFRFFASWQDETVTRERADAGECWVAERDGRLIGTGTLRPPGTARGTPWYECEGVAVVGQLATEPGLQGQGLGSALLLHLEHRARQLGATHVALDTAEGATALRRYYARRGYGFVEYVDWGITNYRSVVLSKPIGDGGDVFGSAEGNAAQTLNPVDKGYSSARVP